MGSPKTLSIGWIFAGIAAVCVILFVLGTYWAGPKVFIGEIAYLGHAILIGLALTAVLIEKKQKDGWLSFREGLKTAFTVSVMGLAIQNFTVWILMNFINPRFRDRVAVELIAWMYKVYRQFGMPEDQIAKSIADQQGQNSFDASHMLMGFALTCILYFAISALIAATLKRKQPVIK